MVFGVSALQVHLRSANHSPSLGPSDSWSSPEVRLGTRNASREPSPRVEAKFGSQGRRDAFVDGRAGAAVLEKAERYSGRFNLHSESARHGSASTKARAAAPIWI